MNAESIILSPPLAFAALFAVVGVLAWLAARLLAARPPAVKAGTLKAYACGEDVADHRARPEYKEFFPFAFFFTIMHVIALVVATVPTEDFAILGMALLFVTASTVGLAILYRN